MKKVINISLLLFILFTVSSCTDENKFRIYEEYQDLGGAIWDRKDVLEFTFEITDVEKKYNIYYNVRNTREYEFYNLYVEFNLLDPKGVKVKSDIQEMYLFDPTTGQPHKKSLIGGKIGKVFDHRFMCFKSHKFSQKGKYSFKVKQYMRRDALPEIQAFGLRVEEAPQTKTP